MSDLQVVLRKRNYDLSKSKEVLKKYGRSKPVEKNAEKLQVCTEVNVNIQESDVERSEAQSAPNRLGYAPDFDIVKVRKDEKKRINFANKLLLSPLTTVGNLPFRRICKEFGADITCGMDGNDHRWSHLIP